MSFAAVLPGFSIKLRTSPVISGCAVHRMESVGPRTPRPLPVYSQNGATYTDASISNVNPLSISAVIPVICHTPHPLTHRGHRCSRGFYLHSCHTAENPVPRGNRRHHDPPPPPPPRSPRSTSTCHYKPHPHRRLPASSAPVQHPDQTPAHQNPIG